MNEKTETSQPITVSLYESAEKIYPRTVQGRYATWRWVCVFLTQAVFYGLPWLEWGSRPSVLFDLEHRRFFIFSLVLYPQDFIYLTGLLVGCALSLFLVTAIAGRVWCGFSCPQTVYSEIFMYIERLVEGDRPQRMKLDQDRFSSQYLIKKFIKHSIWIAISLITGFSFVAYFVPARTLADSVLHAQVFGWSLFWIVFYGFATYGNAGFMREQVCKYMCPYARFQSAMFDQDTLIVTYNHQRGESRGHRSKNADPSAIKELGLGDCVDCNLCVQVCPTGIDIRDGLQYECIGCGACADVCDPVMKKMNYAPGLISFSTERAQQTGAKSFSLLGTIARPRVLIYAFLLICLSSVMFFNLLTQAPFKLDIVRDRSAMSRLSEDSQHHMILENIYRIQIMNASESEETYQLSVKGLDQIQLQTPSTLTVKAAQSEWFALRISVPAEIDASGSHKIFLTLKPTHSNHTVSEATMFLVPSH